MPDKPDLHSSHHSLRRTRPVAHGLTLYLSAGCPYCLKVSAVLNKLHVRVAIVNPEKNQSQRHKLTTLGGRNQVPCLHILSDNNRSQWMYESRDIIRYLNQRFSRNSQQRKP